MLEKRIKKDDIAAVLWSSPNNPSWNVISESELKRMGEMFTKYDVLAIEDNAYFGMDFRVDYSKPGVPPFVPTIAKYTIPYLSKKVIFEFVLFPFAPTLSKYFLNPNGFRNVAITDAPYVFSSLVLKYNGCTLSNFAVLP